LIGAPGATVLDELGNPVTAAGQLYAIHGGAANLDALAIDGVIDLARVASGAPDEVAGVVFLGSVSAGAIGRSTTGAVDVDADGVDDVLVGGDGQAWLIPGKDPKGSSGSSTLQAPSRPPPGPFSRTMPGASAVEDFGATAIVPETGASGELVVGPAGDGDGDGIGDFIVGGPGADPDGRADGGQAYIVFGRRTPFGEVLRLADVGHTVPGLTIDGREAGDALGTSIGGGSDVTGDGVADALVGAPFADTAMAIPADAGQAYVISPVPPLEVHDLRLAHAAGVTTLEWAMPHRALTSNVYRGVLATLVSAGQVRTSDMQAYHCSVSTDADGDDRPDTTDATPVTPGQAFFYLVTAENLTGEGPLGPAGAVPPRLLDLQCP
jgi:hypothetical protein